MQDKKVISTNIIRTYLSSLTITLVLLFILIYSSYFASYGSPNAQLNNFTNTEFASIEGMRGNIFDANGRQLTKNVPRLQLAIIPNQLTNINIAADVLRKIETVTKIPYAKLENKLLLGLESNDPVRPVIIIDNISLQEAIKYSSSFAAIDSTIIIKKVMREYDNSSLFSRIIGSVVQ